MIDTTTGWRITAGSAWSHFVVVDQGHHRVTRTAVCGRRGSTWQEADDHPQRCHECVELTI